MEKVLQFLSELAANNNREWFEANKARYEECKNKMIFTTELLANEIRMFDKSIPFLDARHCMFRIFRDVRFSNDKRPYKTNLGSFIAKGGRKSACPGYYFHIEPANSFVGGGLYMPPAVHLRALREYIAVNGQELMEILNDKEFNTMLPEMYDDRLKTAPQGFPKDHPYIELLRYKSFAFSAHIPDKELINGFFLNKAVEAFKNLHKVNVFLNDALKEFC